MYQCYWRLQSSSPLAAVGDGCRRILLTYFTVEFYCNKGLASAGRNLAPKELNLTQNLRSTYCSEANDRHEASRGLFATAELLVLL